MKNFEIAGIFREIAKILEIKGDNPFRIRAYERAAQNIEGLNQDLKVFLMENKLTDIPGIGKDLEGKIKEILETGKLKKYEELKKTIPEGLVKLLNIPTIGPKKAALLYKKLKIGDIAGLEEAIKSDRIKKIHGIKEKTIANIRKGITIFRKSNQRLNLAQATMAADDFLQALKSLPEVSNISAAGSLRRQKETVGDIDILVTSNAPEKIMDKFTCLPMVKDILAKGPTKASVRTSLAVQADCRVVKKRSFGAALLYFTGSKNFNIKLRQMALKKGLKINEYGIFRKEKFIAGKTENEIFKLLGLSYIEPEMREDTGEIELAKKNKLPRLVELKDIKGDLHAHSKYSDGGSSIEEIVAFCRDVGYSYVAITDHSQSLKFAGGLNLTDLKKKKAEIDRLNSKLKNFRILFGAEVDIDSEGRLDYNSEILKRFDIVIAAIHSGFKQPKEKLTERIVKACGNKYAHIIAHPTGRLWQSREPYEIDFDRIFRTAKDTNTHLEINSFPERLDLNDLNSRRAKEMGVRLAISTDAHTREQLKAMKYGIAVARRAWMGKEDVINTLAVEELLKTIKK